MILTLEISVREGLPPAETRKVFHATGGTIGRLGDNDVVLSDPYVSSRHARIRYVNGAFQIEDTSTNGVFVNSTENRLQRGQPYTIKSGDRILIDPYELQASITSAPVQDVDEGDPFGLPVSSGRPSVPFGGILEPDPIASASDVDPLKALFGESRPAAPARVPRAADLAGAGLMSEHYQPPSPVEPVPSAAPSIPAQIPDNWLDSRVAMPPAAPVQPSRPPAPPPKPASDVARPSPGTGLSRANLSKSGAKAPAPPPVPEGSEGTLAEVLAAAGVDNSVVTPELARNFGRILRVVVAGVIDVLQARQRLKDEFRMRMTTFKPAQNNPLKFSVNADDALYNLLVKRNPAFLGPVDAFDDAFDDIRNHQMAMLAGVRVAFEAMLAEFNPDRLQEEFDRQGKGSLLAVPAKLRYWDQYRIKFSDMVSDADASFRELFGQEFARAYEEQLERLKAADKARNS